MENTEDLLKSNLKLLLLELAARSDHPSQELQSVVHEVIHELREDVRKAIQSKRRLRLVYSVPQGILKS
jgi:hypothetical protein